MNKQAARLLIVLTLYAAAFAVCLAMGSPPSVAALQAALAVGVNLGTAGLILLLVYLLSRAL